MELFIGPIVLAGVIWAAIEYPNARKALAITGGICALLIAGAVWLLMSKPG
jgi:hypothetical protein